MRPTERFGFELRATDGQARTGTLTTAHGTVATPTFMPVGTQGSVKTLSPDEVAATGAEIVLGKGVGGGQRQARGQKFPFRDRHGVLPFG